MTEKEKLDLGEEKSRSASKWLSFIVISGISTLLVAVIVSLYFLGVFPAEARWVVKHGKKDALVEQKPVIYLPLSPPFTANFKNDPEARLVQIELAVASTDQSVIDAVTKHTPMLRNNILMILGGESPTVLKTPEGKDALRKKIKEEIRTVVVEQADVKEGVDEVYFTGFVMQ